MKGESVVFLDTNIFVYAFLASEPRKRAKAVELIEACLGSGSGSISSTALARLRGSLAKKA